MPSPLLDGLGLPPKPNPPTKCYSSEAGRQGSGTSIANSREPPWAILAIAIRTADDLPGN